MSQNDQATGDAGGDEEGGGFTLADLPGFEENNTRRNVLMGIVYGLVVYIPIGAIAGVGDDEEDGGGSGDGGDGNGGSDDGSSEDSNGDGPTPTETAKATTTETPTGPDYSDARELLNTDDLAGWDPSYMDGESTRFSGSGAEVTDSFETIGNITIFDYEHSGDANFIVEVYNSADERTAIAINKIGRVNGAVALPARSGEFYFDVDADGPWSVTVAQPFAPVEAVRTPPVEASGQAADVVGPVTVDGGQQFTASHDGEDNFIVQAYSEAAPGLDNELLVNEIGSVDEFETVMNLQATVWFDVEADGNWAIEVE